MVSLKLNYFWKILKAVFRQIWVGIFWQWHLSIMNRSKYMSWWQIRLIGMKSWFLFVSDCSNIWTKRLYFCIPIYFRVLLLLNMLVLESEEKDHSVANPDIHWFHTYILLPKSTLNDEIPQKVALSGMLSPNHLVNGLRKAGSPNFMKTVYHDQLNVRNVVIASQQWNR